MHWFSDAVAATFMAYAIGYTVGKNMREAYNGTTLNKNYSINVLPSPDTTSFRFSFYF